MPRRAPLTADEHYRRLAGSPELRLQYLAGRHQYAAARSRGSLEVYGRYVYGLPAAAHHRLLIEALEAMERDELDRLLVIWPFGHAKSTWGSIIWPAWYLGKHPDHSIIGASTTGTLANLYQDSVANVFELNERHALTFPDTGPDKHRGWSQDGGLFLQRPPSAAAKDASLVYVGAGGPIIGRRADGLIGDDLVDESIARSLETMLPARVTWVNRSFLSRLKPGGWAVVLGTLWAEGDVMMSLAASGEWVVYAAKALSPDRYQAAELLIPDHVKWRPRGSKLLSESEAILLELAHAG